MKQLVVGSALFIVLIILETSFIASLPRPVQLLPLTLAVSFYLIQYQRLQNVAWWIFFYGLWLDLFHLGTTPVSWILFGGVALCSTPTAKHIFSNRSLYGVIAYGISLYFLGKLAQWTAVFFASILGSSPSIPWQNFWKDGIIEILLLTILFSVSFFLSPRLKVPIEFFKNI